MSIHMILWPCHLLIQKTPPTGYFLQLNKIWFSWGWGDVVTHHIMNITCSFVSSHCKKIKGIPKFPGCFHLVNIRCHHQLLSAFQLLLQEWSSKAFLMGTDRVFQLILMGLARAHPSGIGMTSQRSLSSLSAWACQGLSTFLMLLCDRL